MLVFGKSAFVRILSFSGEESNIVSKERITGISAKMCYCSRNPASLAVAWRGSWRRWGNKYYLWTYMMGWVLDFFDCLFRIRFERAGENSKTTKNKATLSIFTVDITNLNCREEMYRERRLWRKEYLIKEEYDRKGKLLRKKQSTEEEPCGGGKWWMKNIERRI